MGSAERGVEETALAVMVDFVVELGVPACPGVELEVAGFEVDDCVRRGLLPATGCQSTLGE